MLHVDCDHDSLIVETKKLDDVSELPSTEIKLIKIEAEGAEPEVLAGMPQTLKRTRFVAVDMGPERGIMQANTVVECSNFLNQTGFTMRAFSHERCTALFEKAT